MNYIGQIYYIHGHKNELYVGGTTRPLSERLSHHFSDHKLGRERTSCQIIFEINNISKNCYDWKNYVEIILIEKYACKSRTEFMKREQYWINYYKDLCVNFRKY